MAQHEIYTIELNRPEGVTVAELVAYMKEAIEMWGGQRRTDDPLFYPWARRIRQDHKLPAIRIKRRYP